MKKVCARILAIILTISVLASCGSTDQSSTTATGEVSQASNDTQANEQTPEDTPDKPFNDNEANENEVSNLSYTVEYYTEDDDPEGIGCQIKFSDKELNDRVEAVVALARAIQQGDLVAAKNAMNVEVGIEWGDFDEDGISDDELYDYFSYSRVGNYEFTADMSNVKKVEIWQSDEDDGIIVNSLVVYFDFINAENIVVVAQQVETTGGLYTLIYGTVTETEMKESQKQYEERSALKAANSNAKTAYNATAEFWADMETMGTPYTFTAEEFDASYEYSDGLGNMIHNNLKYNDIPGYVFIGSDGKGGFFAQWKESEDSDVIGQYPNAPSSTDAFVQWGSYYSE